MRGEAAGGAFFARFSLLCPHTTVLSRLAYQNMLSSQSYSFRSRPAIFAGVMRTGLE